MTEHRSYNLNKYHRLYIVDSLSLFVSHFLYISMIVVVDVEHFEAKEANERSNERKKKKY